MMCSASRTALANAIISIHRPSVQFAIRTLHASAGTMTDDKPNKPNKLSMNTTFHLDRKLKEEKELVLHRRHDMLFNIFKEKQNLDRDTFHRAIDVYLKREMIQRRGMVEFIYASMARMVEFKVHRDLSTYKKLFSVFPEVKMVAKNMWHVEMMHYPKQQYCAIDLLDKMESHGVIPDDDFGYMILRTFGKGTHVMRKYQRMMYWMPKFKHINPWPIPKRLPDDPTELACLVLQRMAVDLENRIMVWHAEEVKEEEDAPDLTWVACAQSPKQRELIDAHDESEPLYVDGGYHVWARYKSLTHFVLRADNGGRWRGQPIVDHSDELDFKPFYEEETSIVPAPSVHEQEDGVVLAMAITGTDSKDSLKSWIRLLQRTNPRLAEFRVVFRLRTPSEQRLQTVEEMNRGVTKL